jgi:hypothetical protein
VNEEFARSLRARLVEKTTESWAFWYGLLQDFVRENGHCLIPAAYRTDDGFRLGSWVADQRSRKDTMKLERRQRLESLPGWVWDIASHQWEMGFSYLKEFSTREGHCQLPQRYKAADGYRLGSWVSHQRMAQKK